MRGFWIVTGVGPAVVQIAHTTTLRSGSADRTAAGANGPQSSQVPGVPHVASITLVVIGNASASRLAADFELGLVRVKGDQIAIWSLEKIG